MSEKKPRRWLRRKIHVHVRPSRDLKTYNKLYQRRYRKKVGVKK